MTDIAIRVENLSKLYHIGRAQQRHDTLRDALASWRLEIGDWMRQFRHPTSNLPPMGRPTSNDAIWALKDVSFEVKRGQVVGIIGRNGAGKSTLLKILSRITEPTGGRAEIHGRVGSLLEVGTGFHPELTGRENIYLNGALLGMKRAEIEKKFDEIVAFAEIEKFLDTPVKHYSSGMYVRLAFAVAAHLEPEILLVDEVLAVGDAQFQKKCLGKMGDVATEGRAVLFVSHNLAMMNKLCPRSILLQSGRVEAQGETASVLQTYLHTLRRADNETASFGINRLVLEHQRNANIEITNVELLQPDGSNVSGLEIGGGLLIRIHYSAHSVVLVPGFIVMLKSSDGVELCRVSNMPISGYYIPQLCGEGQIELVFESLPITGGRYYISVGVARANVEWLLRLDDVAWFDIAAKDVYGSGLVMDTQRGFLILPHRWQHFPSECLQTRSEVTSLRNPKGD